jgi:2-polyprenyl-3-methyl-5-hydroxy-6-metoxy-1,4-benzoquinol methylase
LRFDLAYLFRPRWDTGISPPELLDYLATHPAGRAVDLGCGSGTNLVTLARNGWQVTGVDLSTRAVRLAKQKTQRAGIAAVILVGDLSEHMKPLGPFDLALDIGCFHAIARRGQYLDNLVSMLRGGGHWLMYGFVRTGSLRFGLEAADLALTESKGMLLVSRTDGVERSGRPSSWFLFEKVADPT